MRAMSREGLCPLNRVTRTVSRERRRDGSGRLDDAPSCGLRRRDQSCSHLCLCRLSGSSLIAPPASRRPAPDVEPTLRLSWRPKRRRVVTSSNWTEASDTDNQGVNQSIHRFVPDALAVECIETFHAKCHATTWARICLPLNKLKAGAIQQMPAYCDVLNTSMTFTMNCRGCFAVTSSVFRELH